MKPIHLTEKDPARHQCDTMTAQSPRWYRTTIRSIHWTSRISIDGDVVERWELKIDEGGLVVNVAVSFCPFCGFALP